MSVCNAWPVDRPSGPATVFVSDESEWLAHLKALSRYDCCRPQLQVVRLRDEFTLPATVVYSPQHTLLLRCPSTSSSCCAIGAVCTATVQSCVFRPFSVCSRPCLHKRKLQPAPAPIGGGGHCPLNKIWLPARGLARHNKRFTIEEIIKIVATRC